MRSKQVNVCGLRRVNTLTFGIAFLAALVTVDKSIRIVSRRVSRGNYPDSCGSFRQFSIVGSVCSTRSSEFGFLCVRHNHGGRNIAIR